MIISLTPETQRLLEERMKKSGFATPDDAVRAALESFGQVEAEELDDETLAAIEEGLAQAKAGQGRAWKEVREELRAKYLDGSDHPGAVL